jgi:hypothetical protein
VPFPKKQERMNDLVEDIIVEAKIYLKQQEQAAHQIQTDDPEAAAKAEEEKKRQQQMKPKRSILQDFFGW